MLGNSIWQQTVSYSVILLHSTYWWCNASSTVQKSKGLMAWLQWVVGVVIVRNYLLHHFYTPLRICSLPRSTNQWWQPWVWELGWSWGMYSPSDSPSKASNSTAASAYWWHAMVLGECFKVGSVTVCILLCLCVLWGGRGSRKLMKMHI